MPEPLAANLNAIRHLIASGDKDTALEKLNELLALQEDAEAHSLRLRLLLEDLRDVTLIQESMSWLERHRPEWHTLPQLREQLQTGLDTHLEELRDELQESGGGGLLARMDDLLPLADRFPVIYLVRGQVFTSAARIAHESSSGRGFERRLPERLARYKPHELPKQAEQALERAVALLAQEVSYYAEAWQCLGELHEDITGDLNAALTAYEKAQAQGLPLEAKIRQVTQGIVQQTIKRLTQHLDGLIDRQQYDKAATLLDGCGDLLALPAVRMRQVDLQLLSGRLAEAEQAYLALLDALDAGNMPEALDFEAGQVAPVARMLPKETLSPLATDAQLPPARYTVPVDNLYQRALCGLVVTYHKQLNYTQMQKTLHRLLLDQTLPAQSVNLLLDDLRQIERVLRGEIYQQQIARRELCWQAEDWPGLVAACRDVVSLPDAQPVDYAWLAAAMHQTQQKPDALAYMLQQVPPEALAEIPGVLGRGLLRELADAGYWAITDRFAVALPNVGGWRGGYEKRRNAYLQATLAQAESRLLAGQAEMAEIDARQILEIEPENPRGRLLMGRLLFARGRVADAREFLLPLLNDPEIEREAALALVEIDIAEGYLLNAQTRLDSLRDVADTPDLAVLVESLEHRIHLKPVIAVEQADTVVSADKLRRIATTNGWLATFAVRLDGVRSVRGKLDVTQRCAELLTALSRVAENLGLPTRYAWRYVGHRGTLRIALLCSVEADSAESARSAAESLWHTLKSMLPLQDEQVYAYKPVMSLPELDSLRQPAVVESAVEIARKELVVGRQGDGEVYMTYPFPLFEGDLRRLLRTLAEQPDVTVLDIHFQPTVLLPWERSAIRRMLGVHDSDSADDRPLFARSNDERLQQAMSLYPEFLRFTQWMAFVIRIHLTSAGQMNPALPNLAATGLFGAARYELVPANFVNDLEVIARNLREVNAEVWGYNAAPPRLERLRYLLTPVETLTVTRIPVPGPDGLPGLPALKIKAAALPANLPRSGTVIGESVTPVQGRPLPVRLNMQDRLRHAYIVGRTGTGKSTLLQNMALQDIEAGYGVGVIDPHGDLVEAILSRIPAHRMQDVVLFDPSDTERPIGLNILDVQGTFEKNMVVAEFIGLMYSMFDPNKLGIVGPRFENAVRNAMLTAMAIPGSTLIEVVRILSDSSYLRQCLEVITDPVVKAYWKDIVGNMSDFHKSEVLDYITSKFGRFVTDHLVRNIIGQSQNALDFAGMMDRGQILLVNLAKGKIGPQNSHFLGLLLVPRLLIAALSRARMSTEQRRLFCLYVDEFHNFTTPAFSVMLSEARKYGMALTVANQFISQLDDSIRESVFGNVGTLLAFQVGVKDAHYLAPELYPVFDVDDMVNLPNYHLLAKMMINGNVVPQFPVRTLPDTRLPDRTLAGAIRSYSRERYGRDAFIVSHEIQQRFARSPKERQEKNNLLDFLR